MDPLDFFSVLYDDLEDLRDLADGVLDIEAFDKTEVVFVEFDLPLSEENSELGNLLAEGGDKFMSTGVAGISLRDGPELGQGPGSMS